MGTPPEGFSYLADFLNQDEQLALLSRLRDLDYQHDTFRGQRLKRAYAQFGYAYVSTGRTLDPAPPLPEFRTALIARGLHHCPQGTPFNQCIVTRYPENSGIGWHTDAPRFGEVIMAVSLGGEGILEFRPGGAEEASCAVLTASGSLYVMHGPARWKYQHQVLPVQSLRYSLTFRHVAEGEGGADSRRKA